MCTNIQFGNKYYIGCDHPPPLDVMSELRGQSRICVEISLCVVPDASTACCVCSEFIRLLPNNFSWSLHLACSSKVVSISDIWGLRCSYVTRIVTWLGLPNTDRLEGTIQAHSVPLILWKRVKTCFGLRHSCLFAELSSLLLIESAEYFTAQKAFPEHKCAPCGLNFLLSPLLLAGIWVVGLLESGKWREKINPVAHLELIIPCLLPGSLDQKSIFGSSNVRRVNSLELFPPRVVSQAECAMWGGGFTHAVFRKGYC